MSSLCVCVCACVFVQLPGPVVGADKLQKDENEDLVAVVRREVDHHNTTLTTITTTLQDAIHAAAVSHVHTQHTRSYQNTIQVDYQ